MNEIEKICMSCAHADETDLSDGLMRCAVSGAIVEIGDTCYNFISWVDVNLIP